MSPQILTGQGYTWKCDIWALGIMFFEMLYGKHPWVIQSMDDLSRKPMTIPLRFPNIVSVSEETKDFIRGCLGVNEHQRFEWNQVFNHPIWKSIGNINNDANDMRRKASLRALQNELSSNPNLRGPMAKQVFEQSDVNHDNTLSLAEFQNMIHRLDPNVPQSYI